jgi:hypothetical protein
MQETRKSGRSRSGQAAAASMTAEQRHERARRGSLAAAVNTIAKRAEDLTADQRELVRLAVGAD